MASISALVPLSFQTTGAGAQAVRPEPDSAKPGVLAQHDDHDDYPAGSIGSGQRGGQGRLHRIRGAHGVVHLCHVVCGPDGSSARSASAK